MNVGNTIMLSIIMVLGGAAVIGICCICKKRTCDDDLDKVNELDITYNDIYKRMDSNV